MEQAIVEPKKTSFTESLVSGINGAFKGFFTGGLIGIVSGAAIGAIIGIFTGGIGVAALAGAQAGGLLLASIGSTAGIMTGVVQSREKNQVSARDVVNVATISYAQGMGVGHTLAKDQATEEVQSHFRKKILEERAARALQQQQLH